ncbi:hypothetical protein PR048_032765 [Dryococelus australis]|uniref:Uncharacterized protein n=1 Tax=Dryococelus australis TaxID=614101 RepID=A0ABQ9G349_9NEOP|nr:hypothetical protein PR048_032765 [Dryococelus australis]
MPLVGGFSRGSPVSPVLSFRRCSGLTSITLIGSEDLAVKSRPNLFTHSSPYSDCNNLSVTQLRGPYRLLPIPSYHQERRRLASLHYRHPKAHVADNLRLFSCVPGRLSGVQPLPALLKIYRLSPLKEVPFDAIPQHALARAFHNFWCRLHTCLEGGGGTEREMAPSCPRSKMNSVSYLTHSAPGSAWHRRRPQRSTANWVTAESRGRGSDRTPTQPPHDLAVQSYAETIIQVSDVIMREYCSTLIPAVRAIGGGLLPVSQTASKSNPVLSHTCSVVSHRYFDLKAKLIHKQKTRSEEIWTALNIEVLRADGAIKASMEQRRNEKAGVNGEIPEKIRRPMASSGTIHTCENPE